MRANVLELERFRKGLTAAQRRSLRMVARPRLHVRFVEPGSEEVEEADDFYEYVVNHELCFHQGKTFHICSAHPEAREVASAGRIPATFRCPRESTACPMRTLLGERPGCDARLFVDSVEAR